MTRSRSEGLDWANKKVGSTGYGGMCLQFTREAYAIPSKYAAAIDAWNGAKHKHKTSSTSGIPSGVPIYFGPHGSPYGHIAVYAGGGKMVTTHASSNKIGKDSVSTWVHDYGYPLLGWSEDLNGVMIPTGSSPAPAPEEDDDMPTWKNSSYHNDIGLTADGEYHSLRVGTSDDGSGYYSVLNGPAYGSGELYVSLVGLEKGHEVDLRFIHVDYKSGATTTVAATGSTVEHFAGSGTTSLVLPFTTYVPKSSKSGYTRKLRFQLRAYGGEKITVQGTRVRMLYWKK